MQDYFDSNTILAIWNDIKNGERSFYVLLVLLALFYFREQIKKLVIIIFNRLICKSTVSKEYTKEDVQNHPIFKNIEFWLTVGIQSIKFTSINIAGIAVKHNETPEYLQAKEEIAKDLLKIKLEIIQQYLKQFLKEYDFEKIDAETLRYYIVDNILKCRMNQNSKYIEANIPQVFLIKFKSLECLIISMIHNSLDMFFNSNNTFTNTTKVYLVMNSLNNYLNSLLMNIVETITSINGDLNGVKYKDKIIGVSKIPTNILKAPQEMYYSIVEEKLEELLNTTNCSRVYILKIYPNSEKDFLNTFFSCVYEITSRGITAEIGNIQKISNNHNIETLKILNENKEIIITPVNNFNLVVTERYIKRGVYGVVLAPIFDGNNMLSGILCLDFNDKCCFEKATKEKTFEKTLLNYSTILYPYIDYPKNYKLG